MFFLREFLQGTFNKNHSELFALASGCVKYHSFLKEILNRSGSSILKDKLINNNIDLAVVLFYQHLVGTDFECAPCFTTIMEKHSVKIQAAHRALLQENDVNCLQDLFIENSTQGKGVPCYARVNLIKCSVKEVLDSLCDDGWQYVGKLHMYRFKEDVSFLSKHQFGLDPLMEDVLVFPFGTELRMDKLVLTGALVLQDRGSCIPAHVLNPPPGSVVLDCCAAPGGKTSHLASLMRNEGRVIAVDRDYQKLYKMRSRLRKASATCVEIVAQNFLTLSQDSKEVADVTMILLDPPCNFKDEQEASLKNPGILKRYQKFLLRHALQFPNVQRVVYSTSSIHEEEGEEVVQEVMFDFGKDFKFVPVLPHWPYSRGSEWFLNSKSFLRVSTQEHLTSNTFVACFERIEKSDEQSALNWVDEDVCECMDETVTRLHHEAARILKVDPEEDSASSLVYSSQYKNLRQLFALVSESIRYKSVLKDILTKCGSTLLNDKLVNSDTELAIVLLFQHLVGADFDCAPRYRQMMRKHGSKIKTAYESLMRENNTSSLTDFLRRKTKGAKKGLPGLPCYARVNLTKCTVEEVINRLCDGGWDYAGKLQVYRFKEHVLSLNEREFGLDPLLEDVLVFPLNTDLQGDRLVEEGTLILRERAKCVPIHVLNPPPGSVVLNCSPSPSDNTSHLASLMRNEGRVLTVSQNVECVSPTNQNTGSICAETIAQDLLTISPNSKEMADVTMILLDPSHCCITLPGQEAPCEDPSVLKSHYISLLRHVLQFPNVQRVVYSSFSTSTQQNEEVVEEVIRNVKRRFLFLPVIPGWPNSRGSSWFLNHKYFLQLSPENHLSCRVFVACFDRVVRNGFKNRRNVKRKNENKGYQRNNRNEVSSNKLNEDGPHIDQNSTENVLCGDNNIGKKRKQNFAAEEKESCSVKKGKRGKEGK